MRQKLLLGGGVVAAILLLTAAPALAQDVDPYERFAEGSGDLAQTIVLDNIFIFIAGVLVFFMQAGFALVESGLTRAKNAANIMMKNLMDACLGVLVFAAVGWGIAYPGGDGGQFIGFAGFGIPGWDSFPDPAEVAAGGYPLGVSVDFFFQAAFAATAATIVSGAVAERTKFVGYLAYTVVITGLIYPIVVGWNWGGGWLSTMDTPFVDFAGSGLVHMVGGVAAFMGALALGPRLGKYGADGKPRAIPGHSIPLAITGVFILFIGWFGFNPGSELAADMAVPVIALLTLLAAMAGGVAAMSTAWIALKKPDVSMTGNGVLAGLVAICSGVGAMDPFGAIITGAVAGVLVVLAVLFIERVIKVDDPVGASALHGVCGFWGLLATGLLATDDGLFMGGGADLFITQLIGGVAILAFVAVTAGILFFGLKASGILRVSAEDEQIGLDLTEHGAPGYGPDLLAESNPAGASTMATA